MLFVKKKWIVILTKDVDKHFNSKINVYVEFYIYSPRNISLQAVPSSDGCCYRPHFYYTPLYTSI